MIKISFHFFFWFCVFCFVRWLNTREQSYCLVDCAHCVICSDESSSVQRRLMVYSALVPFDNNSSGHEQPHRHTRTQQQLPSKIQQWLCSPFFLFCIFMFFFYPHTSGTYMASGVQSSLYNKMGKQIINETNTYFQFSHSLSPLLSPSVICTHRTHTHTATTVFMFTQIDSCSGWIFFFSSLLSIMWACTR